MIGLTVIGAVAIAIHGTVTFATHTLVNLRWRLSHSRRVFKCRGCVTRGSGNPAGIG